MEHRKTHRVLWFAGCMNKHKDILFRFGKVNSKTLEFLFIYFIISFHLVYIFAQQSSHNFETRLK
jgi:hypothetical protein